MYDDICCLRIPQIVHRSGEGRVGGRYGETAAGAGTIPGTLPYCCCVRLAVPGRYHTKAPSTAGPYFLSQLFLTGTPGGVLLSWSGPDRKRQRPGRCVLAGSSPRALIVGYPAALAEPGSYVVCRTEFAFIVRCIASCSAVAVSWGHRRRHGASPNARGTAHVEQMRCVAPLPFYSPCVTTSLSMASSRGRPPLLQLCSFASGGTWRQIAPLAILLEVLYLGGRLCLVGTRLIIWTAFFFPSPRCSLRYFFERHVTLPHPSHGYLTTLIRLRFRISFRYVPMSASF